MNASTDVSLHPRPQRTRERWTDLTGKWGFAHDDADEGLYGGWVEREDVFDRQILVPFPPESRASGIHETGFHPVVWYRRTFRPDPRQGAERLLLHFGAVDYYARVWVNGQLVATHEGGQTPFHADITDALKPGDVDQVIVVRAEDPPTDLALPRGKQFWEEEPRSIWYHRTTGIWQPVWLEPVHSLHVTNLRWTPDLDRGMLAFQVDLSAVPPTPARLRVRLSLRGDTIADDTYTVARRDIRRDIAVQPAVVDIGRRKLLWHPDHPNLIDVELTLEEGGEVVDTVGSYVGLRSVDFSNGLFVLNRVPFYLRLILDQGYWPDSLLTAPSEDAFREEVELVKKMGFNGVRIHQKVEDPRFLYWCDRLGLLVWGEMANAYAFSATAVERLTREWVEILHRDYSHPCIVTWVPLNESWGVPNLQRDPAQRSYVRALYHLTHALDPTRPVIGNDGWEHLASDVWGVHDYALDGDAIRARYGTPEALEQTLRTVQPLHHPVALEGQRHGEPVVLSECGGISYAPEQGSNWFGYGTVRSPEEFLAKYDELITAILDSPGIAGFCYTQLTDTEQETNGLLDDQRKPKLPLDSVRRITRRSPASIPGEVIAEIHRSTDVTSFGETGGS